MKKISCFIICFAISFFSTCKNEGEEKNTDVLDQKKDSILKLRQLKVIDSLKNKNPLMIIPPDSNYTGEYIDKYPNGIIKFKGIFRFGKRHGQWVSFYPNGIMWSELFYEKGIKEGLNTTYFETGKIRYQGFYKNDLQDSIWIYCDSLGSVRSKVLYKNNQIIKKYFIK